jgi:hypothetical protein
MFEFYRSRLSVVESRLGAAQEKCKEIEQSLRSVIEKIREFANRHQIDAAELQRLIDLVDTLSSTLSDSIRAAGAYDLTREQVREAADGVLIRLQALLADRVGDALNEAEGKQAIKEAARRKEERIPPGYAEKKTSPERQAGDYLVWRQLMSEAVIHERPVLLVTNEQKEDWVLKGSSDQVLGPRPELALEMRREARVTLQMVTVVGLLKEAPEYLGTVVSPSTIREAESFPDRRRPAAEFTARAHDQFGRLSGSEQQLLLSMLDRVSNRLRRGLAFETWREVSIDRKSDDDYLLRWSRDGRAVFRLRHDPNNEDFAPIIVVIGISRKRFPAESEQVG